MKRRKKKVNHNRIERNGVNERTNGRMNERKFDNQISSLTTNVNMDNKLHEILTFLCVDKTNSTIVKQPSAEL